MTTSPYRAGPASAPDNTSAGAGEPENRSAPRPRAVSPARQELEALHADFATWLGVREGRFGAANWSAMRADARRLAASIADMERLGLELTERALLALLPYDERPDLRRAGAFCHVLPGLTRDPRAWFADAGWTAAEDWPALARGLFLFVRRCDENPGELWQACHELAALPGSRGIDSALLSPMLNALRPDDFLIVSAATRTTLNHFTGSSFGPALSEYPEAQAALRRFIENSRDVLLAHAPPGMRLGDGFTLFSHWLVNERLTAGQGSRAAPVPAPAASPCDDAPTTAAAPPEAATVSVTPADIALAPSAPAELPPAPIAPDAAALRDIVPGDIALVDTAPGDIEPVDIAPNEVAPASAPANATASAAAPSTSALPRGVASAPSPVRGEDTSPEAAIAHACAPHDTARAATDDNARRRDAADAADDDPARAALAVLVDLAATRGQLLLCGRPGSGTAAWVEAVARGLRSGDGLSERLVFHPGWTRADFLQGLDAHGNRRAGRFMEFCRRSVERKGRSVLAIHALQRADADAVFGEALELLDLRDVECSLSGSGSLAVPAQLTVVAGCDTADGQQPDAPAVTQHFACASVPELPAPRAQ